MATQCPSWKPFQTLWIWRSSETFRRRVTWRLNGSTWRDRSNLDVESCIFLHRNWVVGTVYLDGTGETTECCGLNKTAANLCKYESSKGHHCGIYIFIQKKPMIRPVLMLLLWSLYRSLVLVFPLVLLNWALFVLHKLTTRGWALVWHLICLLNVILTMLKPF